MALRTLSALALVIATSSNVALAVELTPASDVVRPRWLEATPPESQSAVAARRARLLPSVATAIGALAGGAIASAVLLSDQVYSSWWEYGGNILTAFAVAESAVLGGAVGFLLTSGLLREYASKGWWIPLTVVAFVALATVGAGAVALVGAFVGNRLSGGQFQSERWLVLATSGLTAAVATGLLLPLPYRSLAAPAAPPTLPVITVRF